VLATNPSFGDVNWSQILSQKGVRPVPARGRRKPKYKSAAEQLPSRQSIPVLGESLVVHETWARESSQEKGRELKGERNIMNRASRVVQHRSSGILITQLRKTGAIGAERSRIQEEEAVEGTWSRVGCERTE